MEKTEQPAKKVTAAQVLKKYNLTPDELDEMLEQIYNTLEEQGEPTEENWVSRQLLIYFLLY